MRFWKRHIALAISMVLPSGFGTLAAQSSKPSRVDSGASPVLDRELLVGDPDIAGAQAAPDGKYIGFLKPWKDTRNVWVKKISGPYSSARLVTADTKRPIPGFFWSRDSRNILFVQDKAGDENYNVYAVDPSAAPAAGQETPPARNLTDAKGARAFIYAAPKNDPDTLYVVLNVGEPAGDEV